MKKLVVAIGIGLLALLDLAALDDLTTGHQLNLPAEYAVLGITAFLAAWWVWLRIRHHEHGGRKGKGRSPYKWHL